MEHIRSLLGYTVQTPLEYERLLNSLYKKVVDDRDSELLSVIENNDYKIIQYLSQLRLLANTNLHPAMNRLFYGILSVLGKKSMEGLISSPCACAHWLFVPFFEYHNPSENEEENVIPLAIITLICRNIKDLPETFKKNMIKSIRGLGKYSLKLIEMDLSMALDYCIYTLCAINLHLPSSLKENPLLSLLISDENDNEIKELGISLISILNRGESNYVVSLLKLFCDIFSHLETANYFYTNDLKVIIDVLILEITNLPEDDKLRILYLNTLYQLLMNCTSYLTILHKQHEILSLTTTLQNDQNILPEARDICKKITKNCGMLLTLEEPELDD